MPLIALRTLLGPLLGAILLGFSPLCIAPAAAQLSGCSVDQPTALTGSYQFGTAPDLRATLSLHCTAGSTAPAGAVPLCIALATGSWDGASRYLSTSANPSLPYQAKLIDSSGVTLLANAGAVTLQVGTAGVSTGADGTVQLAGTVSIAIGLPDSSFAAAGTYTDTLIGTLYFALDSDGAVTDCAAGGASPQSWSLAISVVRPAYCTIASQTNIAFGTISATAQLASDAEAKGEIGVRCDTGTPFTVYLSDGNHRLAAQGARQMANGDALLPYQLYQDSDGARVWDSDGMDAGLGGSGGVSAKDEGDGVRLPIYARIARGTTLSAMPGQYSDTVMAWVVY